MRPDTATPAPAVSPTPESPLDTGRAHAAPAAPRGYWSESPSTGASAPPTEREQVTGALGDFFTTISSGTEAELKGRLSARSLELLRSMNAESEVWPIAREALGSIRDRRLQFIGGTPDSAALLVTGVRAFNDTLLPAAIILSVLREDGVWKIMYPGAQPLDEHVGP